MSSHNHVPTQLIRKENPLNPEPSENGRSESLDGQGRARPEQGSDWRPSMRCWLQVPGRLRPICSCRGWTSGAHLRTTVTLEHTGAIEQEDAGRPPASPPMHFPCAEHRLHSTCVHLLHDELKLFLLSCNI